MTNFDNNMQESELKPVQPIVERSEAKTGLESAPVFRSLSQVEKAIESLEKLAEVKDWDEKIKHTRQVYDINESVDLLLNDIDYSLQRHEELTKYLPKSEHEKRQDKYSQKRGSWQDGVELSEQRKAEEERKRYEEEERNDTLEYIEDLQTRLDAIKPVISDNVRAINSLSSREIVERQYAEVDEEGPVSRAKKIAQFAANAAIGISTMGHEAHGVVPPTREDNINVTSVVEPQRPERRGGGETYSPAVLPIALAEDSGDYLALEALFDNNVEPLVFASAEELLAIAPYEEGTRLSELVDISTLTRDIILNDLLVGISPDSLSLSFVVMKDNSNVLLDQATGETKTPIYVAPWMRLEKQVFFDGQLYPEGSIVVTQINSSGEREVVIITDNDGSALDYILIPVLPSRAGIRTEGPYIVGIKNSDGEYYPQTILATENGSEFSQIPFATIKVNENLAENLNIRDMDGRIIGSLKPGETASTIGTQTVILAGREGEYYRIELPNGTVGYISADEDLTTFEESVPSLSDMLSVLENVLVGDQTDANNDSEPELVDNELPTDEEPLTDFTDFDWPGSINAQGPGVRTIELTGGNMESEMFALSGAFISLQENININGIDGFLVTYDIPTANGTERVSTFFPYETRGKSTKINWSSSGGASTDVKDVDRALSSLRNFSAGEPIQIDLVEKGEVVRDAEMTEAFNEEGTFTEPALILGLANGTVSSNNEGIVRNESGTIATAFGISIISDLAQSN